MSREVIYIPPKVRQPIVEPTYHSDFERYLGRTLPRAHQAVISALESMRFHGKAIRAVITEVPPPEGARAPHTPLHDLLLEYSRWIIDRIFCDHDLSESPMICCIGHRMDHTKAMIQRGLRYRVMRANVVNWNRRAIPGSIYNPESLRGYTFDHAIVFDVGKMRLKPKTIRRNHERLYATLNPALPMHPKHLHIIFTDHLTEEHLPHIQHIQAEYVAPLEPVEEEAPPQAKRRPIARPISLSDIHSLEEKVKLLSYKSSLAIADMLHVPVSEIDEILIRLI